MTIPALQLGTAWARLCGLMDEAAESFARTSFSSVVRDNWDMAVGLMDSQGRQVAQSSRSVPSFVGTMPRTLAVMLRRYPPHTLVPGDVLISNDGYHGTGHLNDITMVKRCSGTAPSPPGSAAPSTAPTSAARPRSRRATPGRKG